MIDTGQIDRGHGMGKAGAGLRRVWRYYVGHLWCFFATFIVVIMTTILFLTHGYLRNRYVDSLREVVLQNETTILDLANANTRALLNAFIQTGCSAAVDPELYENVHGLLHEKASQGVYLRNTISILLEYSHASRWVVGIGIATGDGVLCQYSRHQSIQYWKGNETYAAEAFQAVGSLLDAGMVPSYHYQSEPQQFQSDTLHVFHIAFPLKGSAPGSSVESVVLFSFNTEAFQENVGQQLAAQQDVIAYMYVSDQDGRIVYHPDAQWIGTRQETYTGQNSLYNLSDSLGASGWLLNAAIDEGALADMVHSFYQMGLLLYWVSLCGVLILSFLLLAWVLSPLRRLSRSIEHAKQGDYADNIHIEGSNEIWQVAEQFNEMILAILETRQQVEQEHRSTLLALERQREAEKEVLESHINAHFICNTLGVISYEAIESGNHRVSVMLKKLSNILRYAFDQKHQKVFLRQEFAWLEQYLYLQKLRFEDKFDYIIELPEEFENWPCCKLMLQPFVENAIIHGFQDMELHGQIRVQCEQREDGRVCIAIRDNGKGMSPRRLEQVRNAMNDAGATSPGMGIGIVNVASRIRLYYGYGAEVRIQSQPGQGTAIHIIIPAQYQEQADGLP